MATALSIAPDICYPKLIAIFIPELCTLSQYSRYFRPRMLQVEGALPSTDVRAAEMDAQMSMMSILRHILSGL